MGLPSSGLVGAVESVGGITPDLSGAQIDDDAPVNLACAVGLPEHLNAGFDIERMRQARLRLRGSRFDVGTDGDGNECDCDHSQGVLVSASFLIGYRRMRVRRS
jgi:hypothetical protein